MAVLIGGVMFHFRIVGGANANQPFILQEPTVYPERPVYSLEIISLFFFI